MCKSAGMGSLAGSHQTVFSSGLKEMAQIGLSKHPQYYTHVLQLDRHQGLCLQYSFHIKLDKRAT
jgi:hypothetical protein